MNVRLLLTLAALSLHLLTSAMPPLWQDDGGGAYGEPDSYGLDTLCALMENSAGTTEGLGYAEKLMDVAHRVGDRSNYEYAMEQKLNMLCALGLYDECVSFADSIIANADTVSNAHQIYFAMFVKVIAFIEQGKFKSAIRLAQKQYDDSKRPIYDSEGKDVSIRVRCNALMGIGLANNEMAQEAEAIDNYTEAINLIPSNDSANLTLRLDLQTSRMQSAQHLADREKALKYIVGYDKDLRDFRKATAGNIDFENLFIEDYALLLQVAYVDVYTDLGRLADAERHIASADSLLAQYPSLVGHYVAELNSAKAKFFQASGKYGRAVAYADSALSYYQEFNRRSNEVTVMKTKLKSIHMMGLYSAEYPITERIMELMDSVYNERYASQVQDMQTVMDVDKLQNEKLLFEQKTEVLSAQRQMWIFISISVLLAAVAAFAFFKRRRDREKQRILSNQKVMLEQEVERQTSQLREQNMAIERANGILAENNAKIEKQNAEITDSINYALKIQQSILPNLDFFKGLGNGGCFAFYVPCHIVSGDFYWARSNGTIDVIVCADCTGHGVPGAFMTMIGTTILNDLFDHKVSQTPAALLESLHVNLINILQQSGDDNSKDGMDLTLVMLNRETRKVSVASAKRPVYLYHAGTRIELDGAMVKRSIGDRDYSQETLPYKTQEIDIEPGDTIYMSSDGFADLYGGPNHKRFMKKRVAEMMDVIVSLPIGEQKKAVEEVFRNWLTDGGKLEEKDWDQLDDVSFMGVRF